MAPERKVDESFPLGQVKIIDFNTPCRLDRNSNGEGIMIFIWEYLPSNSLSNASKRRSLCGIRAKKEIVADRLFI